MNTAGRVNIIRQKEKKKKRSLSDPGEGLSTTDNTPLQLDTFQGKIAVLNAGFIMLAVRKLPSIPALLSCHWGWWFRSVKPLLI